MPTEPVEWYNADRAVERQDQDAFQRYDFAKRIAETIETRQSAESLVLGLYGRWGEGKTSVLNFIQQELQGSNVITITFNPWRLVGEEQLLMGFFAELSEQLKQPLGNSDQAATLVDQYTHVALARLRLAGQNSDELPTEQKQELQAFMAQASLEGLKRQMEELLRAAQKRILIIIDDIDRLDRKEIQALFRLVKLTADFNYTTYLLAFDEDVVAGALGEMYEQGTKAAGRKFLEKIIQVPLHLPAIQPEVMERFFLQWIDNVVRLARVDLDQEEMLRFGRAAQSSIIPEMRVPRHVVRYCNTLTFLLPLLRDEVNVVDLMLVEALKLHYPAVYRFIVKHQRQVTGVIDRHRDHDGLRKRLDPVLGNDSKKLGNARGMLNAMFPTLASLYSKRNWALSSGRDYVMDESELHAAKAIASNLYFKRYFSYAVQQGEIPDVSYQALLSTLSTGDVEALLNQSTALIESASAEELIRRFLASVTDLPTESIEPLCLLMAELGDQLPTEYSFFGWRFSSTGKAARLIISLLERIPDAGSRLRIATSVINTSASFKFAFVFMDVLGDDLGLQMDDAAADKDPKRIAVFDQTEYHALVHILVETARHKAADIPLYRQFPEYADDLLLKWWPIVAEAEEIDSYLRPHLDQRPEEIITFLRAMAPRSSINSGPYLPSDLPLHTYSLIKQVIDVNYLYAKVRNIVGDEVVGPYKERRFERPTDDERLRQFIAHYEHDASTATESDVDE